MKKSKVELYLEATEGRVFIGKIIGGVDTLEELNEYIWRMPDDAKGDKAELDPVPEPEQKNVHKLNTHHLYQFRLHKELVGTLQNFNGSSDFELSEFGGFIHLDWTGFSVKGGELRYSGENGFGMVFRLAD